MAKIFYTVDPSTPGCPIHWLDQRGVKHVETLVEGYHPDNACQEFKLKYPGAAFLKWSDFVKRAGLVEAERAKLAWWNARASK